MKPDVILFDVNYFVDDKLKETFNYQTIYRMEEIMSQESYHRPAQRHPIKREIAMRVKYPDINFGEDTQYAKMIEPFLRTSVKTETPLYNHRFSPKHSATCKK